MGKRSNGTRGTNSSSASKSRKASGGVSELDRKFPNWNINLFISKNPMESKKPLLVLFIGSMERNTASVKKLVILIKHLKNLGKMYMLT